MTVGALLVALAIAVVTASFVLRPFKERGDLYVVSPEEVRKPGLKGVLTALRDLDFDHRTGKVSEQDYEPARAILLARAAEAIADPPGASIEGDLEARVREIQMELKEREPAKYCSSCRGRLLASDLFCPRCGSPQAGVCPSCGRSIAHDDRYCSGCGRPAASGGYAHRERAS